MASHHPAPAARSRVHAPCLRRPRDRRRTFVDQVRKLYRDCDSGTADSESAGWLPLELVAMLRALVEDRFKVRVHNEQRDAPIYTLVHARADRRTGSALRPVPDTCADAMKAMVNQPRRDGPPPCSFGGPPGQLVGVSVTMAMFANVLTRYVGRPVFDRTGLDGSFDLALTFDPASIAPGVPGAPPGPARTDDTSPSIVTALQEQLGLKLESTRGPIDVLVI